MIGRHGTLFFILLLIFASAQNLLSQQTDSVYATQTTPLKPAAYKFVFTLEADISPGMEIDVVFPPQFNLSRVVHAGSNRITGGFTVKVKADTVKAKRTRRGNTLAAGERCDLLMASIINPVDMEKEYSFSIIVRSGREIVAEKEFVARVEKL